MQLEQDIERGTQAVAKLSDARKPRQGVVERIVGYFHWAGERPVWLGAVALEVGQSLARTEQVFDELVEAGIIRPLTLNEKLHRGLDDRGAVYLLIKR